MLFQSVPHQPAASMLEAPAELLCGRSGNALGWSNANKRER
jgi:hypothetical protein